MVPRQIPARCSGPLDRRTWLKVGGLSLGALCAGISPSLAQTLAARADADFSVILFWANGGPSHLDTFDLKPGAPAEIRGEFRPIRTNVLGIDICEHMPKLSRLADKFTIVRSLHHERGEHSGGTHRFLTGHSSLQANLPNSENPEVGAIVAKHLEHSLPSPLGGEGPGVRGGVPRFVGDTQFYGAGPAYLGRAYAPFMVNPNNPISASGNNIYDPIPIFPTDDGRAGAVQLASDSTLRLHYRANLLDHVDSFRRQAERSGSMETWDRHHRRAVEILSSSRTRDAFDLAKEPTLIRQRYGDTLWGKSLLTCRRLVEAGSRFVQCQATYRLPQSVGRTSNWDDHSVNAHIFDAYRLKLPVLDHAMSALIEDLYARGLDRRVLFIFCGEFGRTPRLNNPDPSGRPGRDHWPRAMSVFLAGGGLRMGQVIGATNPRGEYPTQRPLDSNSLLATIYRRFGIDLSEHLHDQTGRPIPILPRGEVIRELVVG
ncbi:MAG: DUF1501 domain-containing protein [Gemmataceae bacterium]|nr:DUF1501 domain-containing protein [Gemmataceae bacterium]